MNRSNIGAVRLSFLTAAVLAILAVPASAQVVERGRTWDDLVASHPCASGLTGRIARVTDCDAADDVGDGGGAFQCWVSCDGSAPWVTQAIGAGGGGLPGANQVTESMLKVVNACTDEYVLTCETTTGDFEWQVAATGTIGGTLTATDDLAVCTDGTGGSTIGACTVLNLDNLRLDLNTISTTDTNGNLNLTPNGTGRVIVGGTGSATAPNLGVGDTNTGLYSPADDQMNFTVGGASRAYFTTATLFLESGINFRGFGTQVISGFLEQFFVRTNGVGSPYAPGVTETGEVTSNEGATAKVYVSLPAASGALRWSGCVQDADGLRYTAAAGDTIRVIDKVTAAAGYVESTTIGSCIFLFAINGTEWFSRSITGVWTDGTFTYDDTSLTTP